MNALVRLKRMFIQNNKTLNTITISRKNILHNIECMRSLQPSSYFFPVLKSNAYGHGIPQILEILKGCNFPYIVVSSFSEYQTVHNKSKFNILLLRETLPENYKYFDYKRTAFVVYNIETLRFLAELNENIKIHLFLNTGMNREGIQKSNLAEFLSFLKENKKIKLEGVMSHLYAADEKGNKTIKKQISLFKEMFEIIKNNGFNPKWKHIGNSDGITKIKDDYFNAWRPGSILYGYSSLDNINICLKPALSLYSTVISLQNITKGDGVSYNHKWISKENITSATVSFGYGEGWFRQLGGKIHYYYNNLDCKQIGAICMNLSCCIANDKMKIGDKIELIGIDKNKKNTVEYIAKKAETIPEEILIRLDKGIKRKVI